MLGPGEAQGGQGSPLCGRGDAIRPRGIALGWMFTETHSGSAVTNPLAFFALSAFAALISSAVILAVASRQKGHAFARVFFFTCLGFGLISVFLTLWMAFRPQVGVVFLFVFHLTEYRAFIVIGVAIATATFALRQRNQPLLPWAKLLQAICLSVALSFASTEIGKLTHDADMRQFFLQSGLSVRFMYLIAVCESLGALGLLLRRTMLPAAIGLILVMFGAVGTHLRNHDPLVDSLDAIHLLITLVCVVIVRLATRRAASA